MESEQQIDSKNLRLFFEEKRKEIGDFAKEVAEREWELTEFDLFLSSLDKEHLDMASDSVKKLRKLEAEDKINLEQFEDVGNEF